MEPIEYLRFAQTLPQDLRFNFCQSGIRPVETREFGLNWPEVGLSGRNAGGMPRLRERVAKLYGVDPARVLLSLGATMVNYLLFGALIEPGDRVLVETPVYEPLYRIPAHFGATVEYVERRFEEGFALPLAAIRAGFEHGAKLLVLTHPHNPSGALLTVDELVELGQLAEEHRALVLVDEVYLELVASNDHSACHFGGSFIICNSLTKSLGFPGVRCGWAIAPPAVVEAALQFNNYILAMNPWVTESLAERILLAREQFIVRAKSIARESRPLFDSFVERDPRLDWVPPRGGVIGFVKLGGIDSAKFATFLRRKRYIMVVPGEYFRAPGFIRMGFGLPPKALEEGLGEVAATIDDYLADPFASM
ncbi:MAG: pyridoxal phosphate-dependent aminotransferase [Myxococcales bacterium]|nr:pyridoxal phosphate-dependent aminotransferase [Myxococcales bacterium]